MDHGVDLANDVASTRSVIVAAPKQHTDTADISGTNDSSSESSSSSNDSSDDSESSDECGSSSGSGDEKLKISLQPSSGSTDKAEHRKRKVSALLTKPREVAGITKKVDTLKSKIGALPTKRPRVPGITEPQIVTNRVSDMGIKTAPPIDNRGEDKKASIAQLRLHGVTGSEGLPVDDQKRSGVRQFISKCVSDALTRLADIDRKQCRESFIASLAKDIEEGLYRSAANVREYGQKARSIGHNLKDQNNPDFRRRVLTGAVAPDQVPMMTAEEMASKQKQDARALIRKVGAEEIQTDWELRNSETSCFEGMFPCVMCCSTKTSYHQLQTLASDEPMTTYVTCSSCGHRWRLDCDDGNRP